MELRPWSCPSKLSWITNVFQKCFFYWFYLRYLVRPKSANWSRRSYYFFFDWFCFFWLPRARAMLDYLLRPQRGSRKKKKKRIDNAAISCFVAQPIATRHVTDCGTQGNFANLQNLPMLTTIRTRIFKTKLCNFLLAPIQEFYFPEIILCPAAARPRHGFNIRDNTMALPRRRKTPSRIYFLR